MNKRILFVLTSHDTLGDTGRKTGFHYEEMATPYRRFIDAGFEVEFASPRGGLPPHDPNSLEELDELPEDVHWFRDNLRAMAALKNSMPVADVDFSRFDAVYFPGGHGAVFDLPDHAALARKLGEFFDSGKPVGAVCHGPAALLGARTAQGAPLVAGLRVNAFTNEEEQAVGLTDTVPFLLADALKAQGARYEAGGLWANQAVRDRNLVTGQNPQSAGRLAELMIEALRG